MRFSINYNFIAFIFLTLISFGLQSQEIWVEDSNTGESLEGVLVFNEESGTNTLTDNFGKVNLKDFSSNSKVNFNLLGYQSIVLSIDEIKLKRVVKMTSEDEVLEEVVLSVARSQATREKIAEQVGIIDQNEIESQIVGTSADILEINPNVRVQKSQGGGGSPVLRGFEANRVLIVVDGVRMNNAIYRSGHLQNAITIDPHNIDRVEVTFGSSSVGYGSDALGGVIHYYTKSPDFNSTEKVKSSFSTALNSANSAIVNNTTTSLSYNNWGSLTSFSYSKFGNIQMGKNRKHGFDDWGLNQYFSFNSGDRYREFPTKNSNPNIQKNTAYDQFDLFQKFTFKLPKDQLLRINIQYSESSNIDRYDKLVEENNGSLRFSEWYYGPQKRLFISPQFKFFLGKKWMKKGTMTFAYQKVDESRVNRKFGEISRSNKLESVDVLSLNTDFFGYSKGGHSYSYGLEWTHNKINSEAHAFDLELDFERITGFSNRRPIPSRYPDNGSSAYSFAVYLNWIYELNEMTSLNAGLRYTSSSLKGDWNKISSVDKLLSSVELDSEALTYTLAVTYRPNKKLQINSLISSGFRNPNIDDIGKIRESSGILLVPNSFLKPEYAYTFESGIKIRSNKQKSYLDLRGFSTLVSRHIVRSDFIVFSDTSTENLNTIIYNGDEVLTQANKNLGNRFIYGLCLDGELSLGSLMKFYGGVNFTSSDKNSDYGPMPSIAPFFGTFTFSSKYRKWSNFLIWKFSGSKKPVDYSWGGEDGLNETPIVAPNEPLEIDRFYGIPSWNILSLLTQYTLKEKIRVTFGLNNIFDIHYRTFASGISSEGRSFQLGVKVKF
jgi:hemoglobin/transferrin/lactoferrin receptor protein